MSHKTHETITSSSFTEPKKALIDAARKAKIKHSRGQQVLHVVFVNLILFQRQWQAIVSVTAVHDIDGDGKPAIKFGHLPAKYAEYYDDLLPEFDNLNLIESESFWREIKKYLLDVHFYQAVHFGEIQRLAETGDQRGFFKSKKETNKIEGNFEPSSHVEQHSQHQDALIKEHQSFQLTVKGAEAKLAGEDYDTLMRNQREGKIYKNLIFDLRK